MGLADLSIQKQIKGGNIKEFEKVFLQYYESLCNYACKITGDMDAAEDIVQEFFYNFWKNRESFTLKLSLKAYLFQSIRNNSLHYQKHKLVQSKYASEKEEMERGGGVFIEAGEMEVKELRRKVETTLEKMPDRISLIFRLNRFEGKKYREIAEMLSISVKTVEADMAKALQIFRKSLTEFDQPVSGSKQNAV